MSKLIQVIGLACVITWVTGGCADNRQETPEASPSSSGSVSPSESECTTDANVDYIDFVKLNDRMYYADTEFSNDSGNQADRLAGDPVGEVGYTMYGNACLEHVPANGDASFLSAGTTIYAMKGYKTSFRLIAGGRMYQINDNPNASSVEEVLDVAGKVKAIIEEDRSNGQTVRELPQANAELFVVKALELPYVDPKKLTLDTSEGDRLFRIELTDGTSVRFAYYPATDALSFGATATTEVKTLLTSEREFLEPIANQTSKKSPDGKFVIETYGENKGITAAGLYPVEGIRLIDQSSGATIWSMPGYYVQEFKWSPDSRYVSVYHEARIWGGTVVVDAKDGSEFSLPGMDDVAKQWKGKTTVSDNRPDPYFKFADWVDDTHVNVTFTWMGQNSENYVGNYVYDIKKRTMMDLNVHSDAELSPEFTETLVAALPERGIFLYGRENGADLHVEDRVYAYDWEYTTPRQVMPAMDVRDYDKDGQEELFVNLNIGSGTGVAVDELHIVEINDNPVKDVIFHEEDYLEQLEQAGIGFRTTTESGEWFGEVKIGGTTHKVSLKEYESDNSGFVQDRIWFGSIVHFDTDKDRLKARFGVGVFLEDFPSPMFIGYVNADVAYEAGKFTMSNYKFALNDE
ncbi:hypothetical protein [Cohnella panacarvi]|uniref:hypothetical protein n=1 Tax=Cohnella panacarvi TaxID=400776 RepID=UPI0004788332|nr:hypothetical protein [Cohnella panacarvi]